MKSLDTLSLNTLHELKEGNLMLGVTSIDVKETIFDNIKQKIYIRS